MGCLCYFHGKNMIAFLVTDGIVISKLSEQETNELSKLSKKIGFKMGGTTVRKPVWELKTQENLRTILPFLKKSYRATGCPRNNVRFLSDISRNRRSLERL